MKPNYKPGKQFLLEFYWKLHERSDMEF